MLPQQMSAYVSWLELRPVSMSFLMAKGAGRGVSLHMSRKSEESKLLCESEEHYHVFRMQTNSLSKRCDRGCRLKPSAFAYLPYLFGSRCIKFVNFIKSCVHCGITKVTEQPKQSWKRTKLEDCKATVIKTV